MHNNMLQLEKNMNDIKDSFTENLKKEKKKKPHLHVGLCIEMVLREN